MESAYGQIKMRYEFDVSCFEWLSYFYAKYYNLEKKKSSNLFVFFF